MDEKIREILEDVYKLDPSLREKENELMGILSDVLRSRPDMHPDADFVRELRAKLLAAPAGRIIYKKDDRVWFEGYRRLLPLGSVALVAVILVISFWSATKGLNRSLLEKDGAGSISSKVAIVTVGDNAFGILSSLSASNPNASGGGQESLSASNGEKISSAPEGRGGGSASDSIYPYPYEPVYYTYVYKGEDFVQNEAKLGVLKRITGSSAIEASKVTGALDFGLFDLRKLSGAKTSNLSFFEDREFGYRTDIDLVRGSASIYKNWEKWPNPFASCRDEACYKQNSLKSSDMPQDEEIISKTNDFLSSYSIDISSYGEPEVNKSFFAYYKQGQEMSFPDEITVIYPLQIEGKSVYESYGDLSGMNVGYDIRNKKASSLYNLTTHIYQSSAYDAEMDFSKLLKAAQNVDGAMPLREDGGVTYKEVKIELDTPFMAYASYWKYEDNQSSEYLVPALIFPVRENSELPAGMYARKRVVVPLIKEFLNQNDGPVRIMEDAVSAKN